MSPLGLRPAEKKRYLATKDRLKSDSISPDDAVLSLLGAMLSYSRDALAAVPEQTEKVHKLHRKAVASVRLLIQGLLELDEVWEIAQNTANWADSPLDNYHVSINMLASGLGCRPQRLRDMLFGTQDDNLILGLLEQDHDCPLCGSHVAHDAPPA